MFDKFLEIARSRGLTTWNQVEAETLMDYAGHLKKNDYAYRTQYLELTTLKQAIGWLVDEKHLPQDARVVLPLPKAQGTDTYARRAAEVRAIITHCRTRPDLEWMTGVVVALTFTGLRIGELVALHCSDIELPDGTDSGAIRLVDESTSRSAQEKASLGTWKGGRCRSFPIRAELRPIVENLPRHRDGYVFHGPLGGRLKADAVRRALIRDVLKPHSEEFPTLEGEKEFNDRRLHSFWHFYCFALREPERAAEDGHAVARPQGQQDGRAYYHVHDDEARRQMGRVTLSDEAGGEYPADP